MKKNAKWKKNENQNEKKRKIIWKKNENQNEKNMKTKINNTFAKWKKMKMKMKKPMQEMKTKTKKMEKENYFQLFHSVASRASHKTN